ncbi:MAG: DUF4349 domain-containing protein [Bacteroidales bacterium]
MKKTKFILFVIMAVFLFSCGSSNQEKVESQLSNEEMKVKEKLTLEESASDNSISSSAAKENPKDTVHKFIRTADLKFKVKNVINATYAIEDIAIKFGGFVTFTNLNSNVVNNTTIAISSDSSLETTYYSVINTMIIRVPNTKLDSCLKEIAKYIDFLDFRIIKAEDVALQLLSNDLTQKRVSKNEKRLINAIDNRGKKLQETTTAEENLMNKQELSDNAKIANLSLKDQMNFSTINLSLYQRQTIKREIILNDKNIAVYEPGFGKKMLGALQSGWNILAAIVVFIAQLWGLILVGLLIFIFYKKWGQQQKK